MVGGGEQSRENLHAPLGKKKKKERKNEGENNTIQ